MVGNVDKLLQWGRVAEVSEMEAETFRQDLDRGNHTHSGSGVGKWKSRKEQSVQPVSIHLE